MIELFKMGGPVMFPIFAIGLVLVALVLRLVWKLSHGSLPAGRPGEIALQALPFWGVLALLLGFLGQAVGHYKGLSMMVEAGVVSPRHVFMGLRECFVSTVAGLAICIIAVLLWGALRLWHSVASSAVSTTEPAGLESA